MENEKNKFGKFADAQALCKAYAALEAEFTKRCTELKAEKEASRLVKEENETLTAKLANILFDEEFVLKAAADEQIKSFVLKNYLASLVAREQPPVLKNGSGFFAGVPIKKPKTLEEAKALAQKLLN